MRGVCPFRMRCTLGVVALVTFVAAVVHAEDRAPPTSTFDAIMRALGGVELSVLGGHANVDSSIRTEAGDNQKVASGKARQHGYRIATYSSPDGTGLRLSPNLGFLDQRISISDFRQDLPSAPTDGSTEIGGICSSPATGDPIDCNEPNTYRLRMRSGFVGVRGGFDLVAKRVAKPAPDSIGRIGMDWFLSADVIVNAAEYRYVNASIGRYRASGGAPAFFRSAGVGGSVGMRLPQLHLATRLAFELMGYRNFDYAEPVEFAGPVTFNSDKNVYERPRVFVKGASLTVWSVVWAVAITY